MKQIIADSFQNAFGNIKLFLEDTGNIADVRGIAELVAATLKQGNKVLACGNGGSMAQAMHFCQELSGRFRKTRPALAGIALSDSTAMSCIGNDFGFSEVFARQVAAYGNSGDLLVVFSTSGKSTNIISACDDARSRGMRVAGITGRDGGELVEFGLCDKIIIAPGETADRIQEIHLLVLHMVVEAVEAEI